MPTIVDLRREKGLTQRELARQASVAYCTINRMENGRKVQRSSLILVCQALGVAPGEIVGVEVFSQAGRIPWQKVRARA